MRFKILRLVCTFPKNRSTATTATAIPGRLVPTAVHRIAFFSNASNRSHSPVSRAVASVFAPYDDFQRQETTVERHELFEISA